MQPILLIQVLRAAAALAVTWHHVLNDGLGLGAAAEGAGGLSWEAGVDVFFVISGFVMVYASEPLFGRAGAARVFLRRRTARIVPLYWVVTSVFLAAALLGPGVNSRPGGFAELLSSYLFVPWPRPDGLMQPAYSPGWTLNYEVFFYLGFALVLPLPRRRAVAALSVLLVAGVAVHAMLASPPPQIAFWTDPIVLEFVFVFGMGIGSLRRDGAALSEGVRVLLVAAAGVLLVTFGTVWPDLTRGIRFGVPAGLLIASATLGPEPPLRGWATAVMVRLGDASYALYLVHPFPMRAWRLVWLRLHWTGMASFAAYATLCVASAIFAAFAVHAWFEAPMTRAANRALAGGARRRAT